MAEFGIAGGGALERKLKELADKVGVSKTLRVGFLEGATYPDGTSVPLVAAIQEFGTKDIPSRPFFRDMIAAKSGGWAQSLGNLAVKTNFDVDATLNQMGAGIKGQLQESIRTFDKVPLAQSTIDKKGFDKQLIDTSVMINSVSWEVLP